MKTFNKIRFLLFFSLVIIYIFYVLLRSVEIINVHSMTPGSGYRIVLVKNFPLTNWGKVHWWNRNKEMLKEKYDVFQPAYDGNYEIIFVDIGNGYKVDNGTDEDSDLLCFDDINTKANCVEKRFVFEVSMSKNLGLKYHFR
ncbi:hypothetical protein Xbed_00854 [Xenorhabdus beddingii]|uniref:Uncharacterized protein n=1 Tax=Xenorhabdus beddingii TaxID=40578 RepID=A0A1Y2SS86_9GAMM|nr:DUF943 family protein [Xenorhabdus beddingii]OTA21201.1 hypothetical protein Xbed_00854 [Xenorhabdus beddingii]